MGIPFTCHAGKAMTFSLLFCAIRAKWISLDHVLKIDMIWYDRWNHNNIFYHTYVSNLKNGPSVQMDSLRVWTTNVLMEPSDVTWLKTVLMVVMSLTAVFVFLFNMLYFKKIVSRVKAACSNIIYLCRWKCLYGLN